MQHRTQACLRLILGLPICVLLTAQQDFFIPSAPTVLELPNSEIPWLGFQLERVNEAVRAQLPDLPKATGFLIASLDDQSPSQQAGLLQHDLIWKFDDQLLINEAQLHVLLSHRKPGDLVKIHFFRKGAKKETMLNIGKLPATKSAIFGPSIESANQPVQLPQIPQNKPIETPETATLELAPDTLIQIEKRDKLLWLSIDHKGVNIFDDELNSESEKKIPVHLFDRVKEVRRTLENRCNEKRP